MVALKRNSLEARIVGLLGSRVVEKSTLAEELRLKDSVLDASLKKLASAGLIGFDVLPDKVYVRLLSDNYSISGVKPTQKRTLVKESRRSKAREYEGSMFR